MDTNTTVTPTDGPAIAYKPKPRKGSQATRTKVKTSTKRPVKLMIDADAYEVLVIHGLRRGETMSDLVTGLVRSHLTDFVVHRKPGPKGE